MTPWEVIEEALVHRKPKRNVQWLADQLRVTIQVVSNWKARGVPARRYREIADVLGLTVDQLEGVEPLPWSGRFEWPFSARLYERVEQADTEFLRNLEDVIWDHLNNPRAPTRIQLVPQSAPEPDIKGPPEVDDGSEKQSDQSKRKRRGKG